MIRSTLEAILYEYETDKQESLDFMRSDSEVYLDVNNIPPINFQRMHITIELYNTYLVAINRFDG